MGDRRNEIDDGLSILTVLSEPSIDLLGVATTFGNGPLTTVLSCTRRLIAGLGRADTPVVAGAARSGDTRTDAAEFLAH